jgi:hypothetical protein
VRAHRGVRGCTVGVGVRVGVGLSRDGRTRGVRRAECCDLLCTLAPRSYLTADSRAPLASLWMFNMSYEHHEMPPIYWADNNDYSDSSTGLDATGANMDDDSTLVA